MPGTHAGRVARPSPWPWLVPVAALAAGALFSSSIRAAQGGEIRSDIAGLPGLIQAGTSANADRARTLAALQSEVDQLTRDAAPADAETEELKTAGDDLEAAAGRTAVIGPALRVALDDAHLSADEIPPGFTVDDVIVHQQDVQAVVNALWLAGAEAMMVQDQRVISTSAVRCVGNTLILQGRVYSPPYVITALGDVDALRAGVERDHEVSIYQDYVRRFGLGFKVTAPGEVTFPAYQGSIVPVHAEAEDA